MQLGSAWSRRAFAIKQPTARFAALAAASLAALATLAPACFSPDTGVSPLAKDNANAKSSLYFPTGIVVSPGGRTLYVTNSDFDLQYNGGTVFSLDLAALRDNKLKLLLPALNDGTTDVFSACSLLKLPADKGSPVDPRNKNFILNPGPCKPIPLAPLVKEAVIIGALASGATLVMRPDGPGVRLFVPVRGDPSLTFLDIADDRSEQAQCFEPESETFLDTADPAACLVCQRGDDDRCGSRNRVGLSPFDNTRRLSLPVEPQGIAVSEDGEAIVVAHQTQASVSLSVNRWPTSDTLENFSKPTVEFVASGLPDQPTEVVTVPVPRLVTASKSPGATRVNYEPGFLVTYQGAAQIDLFRYHVDENQAPNAALPIRPFISRAASTAITVSANGKDSRGIAIDASERKDCEAGCTETDTACLQQCLDTPLRLFVANRAPASLLVGKIETKIAKNNEGKPSGVFDEVTIQDTVPLALGASKVVVGKVIAPDGTPAVRIFVAAFDSRLVFSFDPAAHRIDAVIRTGRGPHALAIDFQPDTTLDAKDGHAFLYIGHFTDSYMGVVDLDMRHRDTFGTMFASVGTPLPPRESK